MADTKIHDLADGVTKNATDEIPVIRSPYGSGDDRRLAASLFASSNPPAVRATKSSTTSIPQNAWTAVAWNTEDYDTNTMHDNATNNSRITFNTAGVYIVSVGIDLDAVSTAYFVFVRVFKNGTAEIAMHIAGGSAYDSRISFPLEYKFAAADYIEVQVYQDSAAAKNVKATEVSSFCAAYVGTGA